jgi:hypothetical protein
LGDLTKINALQRALLKRDGKKLLFTAVINYRLAEKWQSHR